MKIMHSCCPAARLALRAQALRSPDNAYQWWVDGGVGVKVTVIFCPWCAVNLELDRQARAAEFERNRDREPIDIRTRRKP